MEFNRSPLGIRAERVSKEAIVEPRRGREFGWFIHVHVVVTSQKILQYTTHRMTGQKRREVGCFALPMTAIHMAEISVTR